MAEGVVEGSCGVVCHCHANVAFVGGVVEVVFAVAADAVGCPCRALCPCGLGEGVEDDAVVAPLPHVGGAVGVVVFHGEGGGIVFVVAGV